MTLIDDIQTRKSPYSHGLEQIYALENVDPKSIKKLTIQPKQATKVQKRFHTEDATTNQLEFDFGPDFASSVASFVLREPIQVLGLFRHAEKCLLENGKTCLKDLVDANLQEFIFFKGMGQGYVDEIRTKLATYLDGRSVGRTKAIDFAAWIRSLMAGIERKKAAAFLRLFQLGHLIELTVAEGLEVNRLSPEQLQDISEETVAFLKKQQGMQFIDDFKQVLAAFIVPWIRKRLGLATEDEVLERFEKVSDEPALTSLSLDFFKSVFNDGQSLWTTYLIFLDQQLFCVDQVVKQSYQLLIQTSFSYFYKAGISYHLLQLITLVDREIAKSWMSMPAGFAEKALRLSSSYRIRKNEHCQLIVRLA